MKKHVWRPLFVALGFIAVILAAREWLVPESFGIHERGYMYGWHRKSNEPEWQEVAIKYRSRVYCRQCHTAKFDSIAASPHGVIGCQNCHGPAYGHPDDPPTLNIDRSRKLCLRCHLRLPYPTSGRAKIRGINVGHNAGLDCVTCHDPHNPSLKELKR